MFDLINLLHLNIAAPSTDFFYPFHVPYKLQLTGKSGKCVFSSKSPSISSQYLDILYCWNLLKYNIQAYDCVLIQAHNAIHTHVLFRFIITSFHCNLKCITYICYVHVLLPISWPNSNNLLQRKCNPRNIDQKYQFLLQRNSKWTNLAVLTHNSSSKPLSNLLLTFNLHLEQPNAHLQCTDVQLWWLPNSGFVEITMLEQILTYNGFQMRVWQGILR